MERGHYKYDQDNIAEDQNLTKQNKTRSTKEQDLADNDQARASQDKTQQTHDKTRATHDKIREDLDQLKEKLTTERPVKWPEFPDIGLYKDQVLSYMFRQLINFEGDGQLTSAMINNYIKDGLLPRTDGKKYSREHLAGLTEICLLKQVLSVRDTGFLLRQELAEGDHAGFYTKFLQILDTALYDTASQINDQWDMEELSDMTLRLAVSSYCNKLACERLIEIMRTKLLSEDKKKADKKNRKDAGEKPGSEVL